MSCSTRRIFFRNEAYRRLSAERVRESNTHTHTHTHVGYTLRRYIRCHDLSLNMINRSICLVYARQVSLRAFVTRKLVSVVQRRGTLVQSVTATAQRAPGRSRDRLTAVRVYNALFIIVFCRVIPRGNRELQSFRQMFLRRQTQRPAAVISAAGKVTVGLTESNGSLYCRIYD